MKVTVTNYLDALTTIFEKATKRSSSYICVGNVHMCMEAYDHSDFKYIVNSASMVVPDGRPLVWSLKALGEKNAFHVRGSDLMLHISAKAQKEGLPIGLYGGSKESLKGLVSFFKKKFPDLKIGYAISPPFRPLTKTEDKIHINEINSSGIKILFVGLGCPKQEKWMAAHKNKLPCVMIGVGAAFDFFSGRKKHAPRWMQEIGLEWTFRFMNEPKRLWKRYLKHNPRFIWYFFQQLLGRKFQ